VKFAIHHPGVTTAITSMHVEEYARMNIASVAEDPLGWTAAGAARAARDARIATAAHLRDAAIAQEWEISQLATGYQVLGRHLRAATGVLRFLLGRRRLDESAAAILFGGAGLSPPFPTTLEDGARAVLDRRAADLDAACWVPECGHGA
jgi:hypothetical protein